MRPPVPHESRTSQCCLNILPSEPARHDVPFFESVTSEPKATFLAGATKSSQAATSSGLVLSSRTCTYDLNDDLFGARTETELLRTRKPEDVPLLVAKSSAVRMREGCRLSMI